MVMNSNVVLEESSKAAGGLEVSYSNVRRMWQFPEGATDVNAALRAAGLDWEVEKRPVYYHDVNGGEVISRNQAVVRVDDDRQFGIVTDRYSCIQNRDAARLFEPLLDSGKFKIDSMGITKTDRVWVSAEAKTSHDITGKGDKVTSRIIGHWRHSDAAVHFQYLAKRVVCSNVVDGLAYREGNRGLTICHHGNVAVTMNTTMNIIDMMVRFESENIAAMKLLAGKTLAGKNEKEFFESVVPPVNQDDYKDAAAFNRAWQKRNNLVLEMQARYACGIGAEVCDRGNYWAAYNAVTETIDHHLAVAKKRDYINYSVFGPGAELRAEAFAKAMAA